MISSASNSMSYMEGVAAWSFCRPTLFTVSWTVLLTSQSGLLMSQIGLADLDFGLCLVESFVKGMVVGQEP